MKVFNKEAGVRGLKLLIKIVVVLGVLYTGLFLAFQPSHDRDWELGQEVLPHILFSDDGLVTIEGYRNFQWDDAGEAEPNYETVSFALDDLDSADVFISHFADFEGLAHIFVSFGTTKGEQFVISFETRREISEEFSPILGILRQFEIIYVVGSEEDIVGLRTDARDERLYLYPTKASEQGVKNLFLALAEDINSVHDQPRIYNTLTANCTNEITRRVEDISDIDFPLSWKTVLPGFFDEVLYEMGLIDTDGSFKEIKARHLIDNESVDRRDETFSADLRK